MTKKKRKQTNYERGRITEYRVIHELKEAGYISPVRTAGSHGMFDIIAIQKGHVLFVQVKRSKTMISFTRLYKEDLEEILDIMHLLPSDAQVETWVWVDHKGWMEKLVIKPAGLVFTPNDIDEIREELQNGRIPFENSSEC